MVAVDRIYRFFFCSLILCLAACSSSSTKAPVTARPDPGNTTQYRPSQASKTSASHHTVSKGDTLYSIAWRYGLDYRDLARWNGIKKPYVIYPKQHIALKSVASNKTARRKPAKTTAIAAKSKTTAAKNQNTANTNKPGKSTLPANIKWYWPVKGKIVRSNSPIAKKGIDISGKLGQKIKSAAQGEVVYSGSGLLGYGKLIIVKHNDVYLSAYAHNNQLLVKEGDRVKAGQQIATMGLGNKNQPLLHFEIRKNGKPANPLAYLPKQKS